jgi:hypothetical protein
VIERSLSAIRLTGGRFSFVLFQQGWESARAGCFAQAIVDAIEDDDLRSSVRVPGRPSTPPAAMRGVDEPERAPATAG